MPSPVLKLVAAGVVEGVVPDVGKGGPRIVGYRTSFVNTTSPTCIPRAAA